MVKTQKSSFSNGEKRKLWRIKMKIETKYDVGQKVIFEGTDCHIIAIRVAHYQPCPNNNGYIYEVEEDEKFKLYMEELDRWIIEKKEICEAVE